MRFWMDSPNQKEEKKPSPMLWILDDLFTRTVQCLRDWKWYNLMVGIQKACVKWLRNMNILPETTSQVYLTQLFMPPTIVLYSELKCTQWVYKRISGHDQKWNENEKTFAQKLRPAPAVELSVCYTTYFLLDFIL